MQREIKEQASSGLQSRNLLKAKMSPILTVRSLEGTYIILFGPLFSNWLEGKDSVNLVEEWRTSWHFYESILQKKSYCLYTQRILISLPAVSTSGRLPFQWMGNEQKAGSPQMWKNIPAAEHNLFAIF